MNFRDIPLRLQAGQIVHLRREQLPAAKRVKGICASGSEDSGWRVITEACAQRHDMPFALLNAAWARLGRAEHAPGTRADLRLVLQAIPADQSAPVCPLPRRWGGLDVRPWITDGDSRRQLLGEGEGHPPISPRAAFEWWPWWKRRGQAWDAALERQLSAMHAGHEPDRAALIAHVLCEGSIEWLPLIGSQPRELWLPLLRVVIGTRQHLAPPPARARNLLEALRHAVERSGYARTAQTCFQSLANGCTPRFVALALRFHLRWKLNFQTLARPRHEPRARELRKMLRLERPGSVHAPLNAWKCATGLDNWSQAVAALFSRPRPKCVRDAVLEGLRQIARQRKGAAWRWKHLLERWDDMLRELDATPRPLQEFAAALVERWLGCGRLNAATAEMLVRCLRRAREFQKCPSDDAARVMVAFAKWDPSVEHIARVSSLDESVWHRMMPAIIGWSACTNVEHALKHIHGVSSAHLAAMLAVAPLEWARTMQRIGELKCREVRGLWTMFCEHPLAEGDIEKMPLGHAIVLVDAIHDSHPRFPGVPEKLRDQAERLPQHVLRHYRDELRRSADRLRLAVLEDLAERALRRRFPHLRGDHVTSHTLRIAAGLGVDNRRPMRRLIRACESRQGTRAWSLSHPANENWMRLHPAHRVELWTRGFVIERELREIGALHLGPEDDLEALLRMGTDFGTCLSAGSFNCYSTVANALDANKRVIFARDTLGRPWARQLVAITESGHLACFPVYARRRRREFEQLFAAYDHTLAHLLRLPLWRSHDQEAPIAKLVCQEWYDDGIWRP